MDDKVIVIEAEDAVLERLHVSLCERIEAWLHCPFTVRLVERPEGVRRPPNKGKK